jgi:hypothetical protein
MEPVTTAIMLAAAGASIGALVNYFRSLFGKHSNANVQVKVGNIEISVKGPISTKKANDIVRAINDSHALES